MTSTISNDSSGRDASSPSGPSPSADPGRRDGVALTWATRLTVTHTILLSVVPYLAVAGEIPESWASEPGLLILFLLGPMTAFALLAYGRTRVGSILYLSMMPASVFAHLQFLYPWVFGSVLPVTGMYAVLYVVSLAILVVNDLIASSVAFSILRTVHEHPSDGSVS